MRDSASNPAKAKMKETLLSQLESKKLELYKQYLTPVTL